jgi:hypothetical protein
MKRLALGLIGLLALGAGPCTSDRNEAGVIAERGVVHQGIAPECPNVWRIDTADGRMLWPVDKPEFQVEGLRVRFTARERNDLATTCMAGTVVELISIEKE